MPLQRKCHNAPYSRLATPPPFKWPVGASIEFSLFSLSLCLAFSFYSRGEFYRIPLCRPNLGAFFDSGHGFAYAANFLLTLLDHARCGTPEFLANGFPNDDSPRHGSVKLNEVFETLWRNSGASIPVYYLVLPDLSAFKNCYERPFCHRLRVTNRILLIRMNVKSHGTSGRRCK